MRITLPDIVELPEPRVGDDGWSRDVGKTRLESIREQAENHCCKDEREGICPEEGNDNDLRHDILQQLPPGGGKGNRCRERGS